MARHMDFDMPRCREASRPAGPSGPLASRALSVLPEERRKDEMQAILAPEQKSAMTLGCLKRESVTKTKL